MKRLICILIVVIIAVAMVITCPDKEQHLTALNNEWTSYMDEKRMEEDAEKQTDDPFSKGLNMLIYSAAGSFVKAVFEQQLIVKNNFIYSTGEINTDEGSKVVSLGLLGHVFVFLDADKIKEGVKNNLVQ